MKMFMFKSILIASLMFLSVLFGMQQAYKGISNMKGYEDKNFKSALTVQNNHGGELEVSLLGNDVDSHDIEKKREKLEKMKVYNFFSSLGKKIANTTSNVTKKIVIFLSEI
ncbi:YqxA family protein [Bacillus massilinigeriensis]|uniref:YqxA family protein n=1 Tax=Bacillus massilionigeriensis TaxID=1805475 RepID=UPI00096B67DC|nr:YqxA family protein [Bacillus massilionigeriensis]